LDFGVGGIEVVHPLTQCKIGELAKLTSQTAPTLWYLRTYRNIT